MFSSASQAAPASGSATTQLDQIASLNIAPDNIPEAANTNKKSRELNADRFSRLVEAFRSGRGRVPASGLLGSITNVASWIAPSVNETFIDELRTLTVESINFRHNELSLISALLQEGAKAAKYNPDLEQAITILFNKGIAFSDADLLTILNISAQFQKPGLLNSAHDLIVARASSLVEKSLNEDITRENLELSQSKLGYLCGYLQSLKPQRVESDDLAASRIVAANHNIGVYDSALSYVLEAMQKADVSFPKLSKSLQDIVSELTRVHKPTTRDWELILALEAPLPLTPKQTESLGTGITAVKLNSQRTGDSLLEKMSGKNVITAQVAIPLLAMGANPVRVIDEFVSTNPIYEDVKEVLDVLFATGKKVEPSVLTCMIDPKNNPPAIVISLLQKLGVPNSDIAHKLIVPSNTAELSALATLSSIKDVADADKLAVYVVLAEALLRAYPSVANINAVYEHRTEGKWLDMVDAMLHRITPIMKASIDGVIRLNSSSISPSTEAAEIRKNAAIHDENHKLEQTKIYLDELAPKLAHRMKVQKLDEAGARFAQALAAYETALKDYNTFAIHLTDITKKYEECSKKIADHNKLITKLESDFARDFPAEAQSTDTEKQNAALNRIAKAKQLLKDDCETEMHYMISKGKFEQAIPGATEKVKAAANTLLGAYKSAGEQAKVVFDDLLQVAKSEKKVEKSQDDDVTAAIKRAAKGSLEATTSASDKAAAVVRSAGGAQSPVQLRPQTGKKVATKPAETKPPLNEPSKKELYLGAPTKEQLQAVQTGHFYNLLATLTPNTLKAASLLKCPANFADLGLAVNLFNLVKSSLTAGVVKIAGEASAVKIINSINIPTTSPTFVCLLNGQEILPAGLAPSK